MVEILRNTQCSGYPECVEGKTGNTIMGFYSERRSREENT